MSIGNLKQMAALVALAAGGTGGFLTANAQVDNRMLSDAADGTNWPAIGRTFDESHYSPLSQVTDKNIGRLGLASFYDLPAVNSVETAPLEIDGILYFAVGYSVIRALDARTSKLLWQYDPDVTSVAGDKLKPAWGTRGIAFWDGKIYAGTQDGRLIAVDAKTGKLVWSVATTEPDDGRYITGAPRVFNGKVIIGHAGNDFLPTRGYVTAYDATTGKQLWRFYTVPGEPAKGFEDEAQALAAKTWSGDWWKFGGGGTVWNAITYDPQFNRIYIGTGNGQPWNNRIRGKGGDTLFTCSIVALDADTGKYVWHYQINPGEEWDYDTTMDMELATLPIGGKARPVLLNAPKDGFFYVIDRETGKLLSAEKFAKVNWADHIDLKTGRPVENPEAHFVHGEFLMYPGFFGAHNIQPMSFNPMTRLVYIPAREQPSVYSAEGVDPKGWKPDPGWVTGNNGLSRAATKLTAPLATSSLLAWDPVNQKRAWSVPTPGASGGGTATTAGNLVFQGQADGKFNAYSADSGMLVWSFDAHAGILAQPISYRIDGKQYITVIAGYGGGTAALSGYQFGWDFATQPRRVLTFTLDGIAQLPPTAPRKLEFVDDVSFKVDPKLAEAGAMTYALNCIMCHGISVQSGGSAPDLRASPMALSKAAFTEVVRNGALVPAGMPRFAGFSDGEIDGLLHYIRATERESAAVLPPR